MSNGGFLGILDTESSFSTVSYSASGSGSLFDNVTYSAMGPVPEASTCALMAVGSGVIAFMARRRKT